LGEVLRKIITQNINRRLTKISRYENKIELHNKRADSADQLFAKVLEKINSIEDFILKYVTKPISLECVAFQPIR